MNEFEIEKMLFLDTITREIIINKYICIVSIQYSIYFLQIVEKLTKHLDYHFKWNITSFYIEIEMYL